MKTVEDVRNEFIEMLHQGRISDDGNIEIINASFIADEPSIFGEPNLDWHRRELDWYLSCSLNINDIEQPIPAIWKQVASVTGEINSNYGWCIYSKENKYQFANAIHSLVLNPNTRQAVMIYIRPSMHGDAVKDGASDFMCTYSTQLLIRNNQLHYIVNMRSNDAVFGYKGDLAWHKYVYENALSKLHECGLSHVERGNIFWNAGSLHIYPRHFHLVSSQIPLPL